MVDSTNIPTGKGVGVHKSTLFIYPNTKYSLEPLFAVITKMAKATASFPVEIDAYDF